MAVSHIGLAGMADFTLRLSDFSRKWTNMLLFGEMRKDRAMARGRAGILFVQGIHSQAVPDDVRAMLRYAAHNERSI
jgi:hypothetical protein